MFTTYRQVLALPGARAFSASGLLARLPISMVSLGIVVLVSTRTGSYGLAGGVSAAYLVGNAGFAVAQARLVDRHGQSRVLPWTISVFALGLALLMAAVEADAPTPVPHLCALLSGAALPNAGSCVRARWSLLVRDRRLLQTAFAFEAVVDETVFLVGPTAVTFLATVVHPLAGLVTAVAAALVGTFTLVAQRRTEPPAGGVRPEHGHGPLGWRVMAPLTVSAFATGMLFGGTEVATVAFADEHGIKPVAGVVLAVWALGSLVSGAVVGALHLRSHHSVRYRWSVLALGVLMSPLSLVGSVWLLGALLFVAGMAISPTLIASVAWIEETVPAGRITEALSINSTGLAAGVAPGAALVGVVVDHAGASPAYLVPAAAGLLGAVVAFASVLLHHDRPPTPVETSLAGR